MGLIEISVAVIALAFVVLVVYVVKTLMATEKSMNQLNDNLLQMKEQVDQLSKESAELIKNTNMVTVDLHKKSKSLDGLFSSIEETGQALHQVTSSVREVSTTLSNSFKQSAQYSMQHQDRITEILKYVSLGLNLWQQWQAQKKEPEHTKESNEQ